MLKDQSMTYVTLFSSAGVGCHGFQMEGYHCIATNELLERRMNVQRCNHKCEYDSGYIVGDISAEESLAAATRQYALVCEVKDYLKDHPKALVVNLGCGLDTAGHQADNGQCRFANVDFPNVIEVREQLMPSTEREKNIGSDLNDQGWFDKIDFRKEDGAVFIASGVFVYFKKADVKKLFCAMAERFPGARLAFDGQNKRGMEMDLKAVKSSGIDVSTNFYLEDPEKELLSWSDRFARVQWKRMSTGYIKPDKRFGVLYRLMAPYADKTGMSQLDVIDFRED